MIKNENYYVVHGWMKNVLGLKGNHLLIYAVLYGFTQDSQNEFRGTVDYIKEFIGAADRKTVLSGLTKLVNLGYVRKVDYNAASGKTNGYICVPLEELGGVQKTDTPPPKKRTGGVQKTDTPLDINIHYKESYKEIYKEVSKKEEKKVLSSFSAGAREEEEGDYSITSYDEILDDFCVHKPLRLAIFEFIKHLQANKIVVINSRLESLIAALDLKYRNDNVSKIAEINQAIRGGLKYLPCEAG